ncbi:NrdH-redoxin [candidate division WOR-1 bacterium RIFOXYA2_FULL_36_21]|uniref:NrdH-redoxin n=1 Tax=candidate division WOR-1 bacterium RIFOXYB2_FULL_36_35 TaxID=1802578 RepID=A0A1F4S1X3_UNCSA|nr:MAG: NrdH-redoxin [candidate division WOR-1 bacterium RIFOXYA2_FULL_36_21]OGC14434.1 MAG: NrdH-redoxin [candidate division WOR-1 bacterium RIFOXYB2_FULL_36_35]OGC19954.1 MAG: NrdH-redoxin [candidate division WOR-1 bacterium RIFOXYA12_FULL_36_13]
MLKEKIKVYSTPTCPYCKMAKNFLLENNITFEDIDVSTNQAMAQEMIQKSGQMGVPVFDIDGKIIIGFNKPEIKLMLGLK